MCTCKKSDSKNVHRHHSNYGQFVPRKGALTFLTVSILGFSYKAQGNYYFYGLQIRIMKQCFFINITKILTLLLFFFHIIPWYIGDLKYAVDLVFTTTDIYFLRYLPWRPNYSGVINSASSEVTFEADWMEEPQIKILAN